MNAPEHLCSGAFVQSSCITEGELVAMAAPHKRIAFYQKVLAMLCCCVVALGFVQPPRARAIAAVDDAYMLVAAYLDACGLSWSLTGTDKQEFAQAVADMVTSYTGTIGTTVTDWMTTITQASVVGGKLYLSKAQIGQLSAFANWLIGDKGITAGGSSIPIATGNEYFNFADGSKVILSGYDYSSKKITSVGTAIDVTNGNLVCSTGYYFASYSTNGIKYCTPNGSQIFGLSGQSSMILFLNTDPSLDVVKVGFALANGSVVLSYKDCDASTLGDVISSGNVVLAPAQALDVPDTSTMTDDETLAIDVGATSGTLSDVLAKIWESIQAGTMSATKEVVKGSTATGEVTDVDDLGLPSLAAIITTRFPFSIPWDIAKGIELLAAPPKTPVFTVDFFAPISGLVGGWKGSTELTLDFSKFDKLGALCRWVSTIGFCLFLASATKRLAWTA